MIVELDGGFCRPALDYTITKNMTACQGRLHRFCYGENFYTFKPNILFFSFFRSYII